MAWITGLAVLQVVCCGMLIAGEMQEDAGAICCGVSRVCRKLKLLVLSNVVTVEDARMRFPSNGGFVCFLFSNFPCDALSPQSLGFWSRPGLLAEVLCTPTSK